MSEKKSNPFREKFEEVYMIVSNIPPGKVMTYGQIAMMIGGLTPRQVGYAMRTAPSGLPAHRVVSKSGKLSPEYVFAGQDVQKKRLEAEGVTFTKAGRIDLKKHIWESI